MRAASVVEWREFSAFQIHGVDVTLYGRGGVGSDDGCFLLDVEAEQLFDDEVSVCDLRECLLL